jgi:transposase-like protein
VNTDTLPRIPVEVNGIQYNFCKNPKCSQFGVPASQEKVHGNSTYTLTGLGTGGLNIPLLRCNACREHLPMKSNQGIVEEIARLSSYLAIAHKPLCCSNTDCSNTTIPVGTKKAYKSFGTTAQGAKRYQCLACKKTLSIPQPTQHQHHTDKNIQIFKMLVNKVPLSRIINMLDISWSVLYGRLNFIHRQCLAFVSAKEAELKDKQFNRLYVAVDRQDYTVNWTERKDKRNITLHAMASADNSTGYVFGIHPNFDYSIDKIEVEADAKEIGDNFKTVPFRKYARLWLDADYTSSSNRVRYDRKKLSTGTLKSKIEVKYEEATKREDVEVFDIKTDEEKLPNYGVQIHAEYTMIAHFHFLKTLCGNVDKWRFFLDQDSGIRGACLSAFKDEVKDKTTEAFYVSIEKQMTVDQKRKNKADAKRRFDLIKENNPTLTDNEVKIELFKEEILAVQEIGSWKDRWVKHPLPNMSESNKAMCWLTEHDEFDLTHKAWLYNKASLHGIDSFFQKVRRRICMLERPIGSASNAGRTYNGYGAYDPANVIKLLEIFRVVHNFIDTKKEEDKSITTPAMRLGLVNKVYDYKDILDFQ